MLASNGFDEKNIIKWSGLGYSGMHRFRDITMTEEMHTAIREVVDELNTKLGLSLMLNFRSDGFILRHGED